MGIHDSFAAAKRVLNMGETGLAIVFEIGAGLARAGPFGGPTR